MPSLSRVSLDPTFAAVGCMPGGICTAIVVSSRLHRELVEAVRVRGSGHGLQVSTTAF